MGARAYLATLSTLREQITALEALVIASFVRGLSTRDVEAALVDALGERASVSRSTVSRICEQIKPEFEANKTVALAALVAAVADLRAAQQRLHQAEAARASA